MMTFIDKYLNAITMYRLVLYYLALLLAWAAFGALFGLISFNPLAIIFSTFFLCALCFIVNTLFARIFKVHANTESFYITAFILALIINPPSGMTDWTYLVLAALASAVAMASKYLIVFRKKHIFNPAALAVVVTVFAMGFGASWWVRDSWMLAPVLVGGLLIVRKIERLHLVLSFIISAVFFMFVGNAGSLTSPLVFLRNIVLDSMFLFFATIMLTEPQTTPPTRQLRIWYGVIVGFLFAPWLHIGPVYATPELALVLANIFVFAVSPKGRYVLSLKEKKLEAGDVDNFFFEPKHTFDFKPGQYMEWTLGHEKADLRGNRRYFTLASSPTEEFLMLGVRFYEKSSSFKQKLMSIVPSDKIVAGNLAGDFTMPKDVQKKLAFIAGGIGITPFRSMVKYLLDTGEKRDIILLFSNSNEKDITYKNIFDEAKEKFGMKTVYALTDDIPDNWQGISGRIDKVAIEREIPDYKERIFYISGPRSMIDSFKATLRGIGVPRSHIKEDFFPGFV